MSLANVKNASSTFMEALADVSMNLIPYSMASSSPRSLDTYENINIFIFKYISRKKNIRKPVWAKPATSGKNVEE